MPGRPLPAFTVLLFGGLWCFGASDPGIVRDPRFRPVAADAAPAPGHITLTLLLPKKTLTYARPLDAGETVGTVVRHLGPLPWANNRGPSVWVRRLRTPAEEVIVLPVDWMAITITGSTSTDYTLHPGDRIYVSRPLLESPRGPAYVFDPLARIFGISWDWRPRPAAASEGFGVVGR